MLVVFQTNMKPTVEHSRFPEATVEAVIEIGKVTREVLWTDAMMDTVNIAFYIRDLCRILPQYTL